MLYANLMIGSDQTALEQRPHALDAVRVDIAAHPFLGMMVNAFVFGVLILDSVIARVLIGHDAFSFVGDHLFNERMKDFLGSLLSAFHLQMDVSTALDSAEYHSLVSEVSAPDVTTLSANIGLVALDRSLEHFAVGFFNCLTDTVTEIPCRLVAYGKSPFKLIRGHRFLGLDHKVDREKPFPKW